MLERRTIPLLLSALLLGIHVPAKALTLPLHRGEQATFTIIARNPTANVAEAAFRSNPVVSGDPGTYTLVVIESPLCEVIGGAMGGFPPPPVEIRFASLPAGSIAPCTLRVQRAADAIWPVTLRFERSTGTPGGIELSDSHWQFGPLVDVSLRSEQVEPFPSLGEHDGLIRIYVTNRSPWDIDRVDFGECQGPSVAPFILDNGFTGGCEQAELGPTCFAVGPPSIQFGISGIRAGETRSCLLRATALEALYQPVRFGLRLLTEFPLTSGDEWLFDYDTDNDLAILQLAPRAGPGGAVIAVPIDRQSVVAPLGILILLAAWRLLRRRRFSEGRDSPD